MIKMTKVTFILLVLCIFINLLQNVVSIGEKCGLKGSGICKVIQECPEALELITSGNTPSNCGFSKNGDPIVCCSIANKIGTISPNEELTSEPVSQKMCRSYKGPFCSLKTPPKFGIVGGIFSKPKELPFMGLVGYGNENEIDWACGCSLISEKFVLSAGHCTRSPSHGIAKWVRLGELDLSTENDTSDPQNFRIIKHYNHPNYQPPLVYNDIAIFELNSTVNFSSFIRPICLPTQNSYLNAKTVFGAGWGLTDFVGRRSTALLKVDLDLFQLNQCANTGKDKRVLPRGLDERSMLCAGSAEGGKDTCLGDSGGPLFLPPENENPLCSNQRIQIGVTSFGKQCALKGFPGVYTNVLNFVPWIESIVWAPEPTEPEDDGPYWSSRK